MRDTMKYFEIYEKITPVWGEVHTDYVGIVRAKDERAALERAKRIFKVDRRGVPARARIAENLIVK